MRIYCILCLVRIGADISEIISVYCSLTHSILEYACPVWHPGLTLGHNKNIEIVQKRLIKMPYPSLLDANDLSSSDVERMYDRWERLMEELFSEITNPHHVLHDLLLISIQTSYGIICVIRGDFKFQLLR